MLRARGNVGISDGKSRREGGSFDPEASESSVVIRGRLLDETATMLGLNNLEVGDHHARIEGTLGTYSLHLGSGVVHRIPGNAICIVSVSAQHRGRIFLPFADDDSPGQQKSWLKQFCWRETTRSKIQRSFGS